MLVQKLKKYLLIFVGTIVLGFVAWIYGALHYVYSSGERAGYVQKISRRGWLFKTWEGELAMVNLPGAMPEKFVFSVRDSTVASEIQKTLGHRVILTYHQHKGIPTNIVGETQYFIVQVRSVEDAVPPASLPAKT